MGIIGRIGAGLGLAKSPEQKAAEIEKKCEDMPNQLGEIQKRIENLLKILWDNILNLWRAEVANKGVNAGSKEGSERVDNYSNKTYAAILKFKEKPNSADIPDQVIQFENFPGAKIIYPGLPDAAKRNFSEFFELVKIEHLIAKGKIEDAKKRYRTLLRQKAGLEKKAK